MPSTSNTAKKPVPASSRAKSYKKGGNLTKDLASLSVPFGIILAQKGLRQYLDSQKNMMKSLEKKTSSSAASKKAPAASKKTKPANTKQ